jgi:hypothetical protein
MDVSTYVPYLAFFQIHTQFILIISLMMLLSCTLFGLLKSFSGERSDVLSTSFFIVIIAATILLVGSMLYQIADNCIFDKNFCISTNAVERLFPWFSIIFINFFANLILGFIGITLGTLLFSCIEWLFETIFSISIKNSFRN